MNDDLISRQDAIDAIHEDADWLAAQGSDWQVERMERDKSILKSLPSAQPIIRCKDCVYWDSLPSRLAPEYHECVERPFHINTTAEDFCSRGEKNVENS